MTISEKLRQQVTAQANYRCEYCNTSSRLTGTLLVMEHILPRLQAIKRRNAEVVLTDHAEGSIYLLPGLLKKSMLF